ncbi:MAG: AtpZ/AtpI family protein [Chitinophagaceae bacterium]|jgi:F0F1-type ATP synthase assembly protein I|nr:MAG: AtpZ/AtpI family protein [Chitinophagaceae bacterium]HEX2845596.1 AtpZ/AtpI family protein [Chitinophagaceae bacterium]
MDKNSPSSKPKNILRRYAALGTEMLVSIGIAVFIGLKADQWLHTLPLFSCVLPLLVLIGIFYKLIRETGNTKKNEPK